MSRLLTWDNDTDILEMLNRHFKATSFERYPAAMITIILEESAAKVLGKNYQKDRIGKRKAEELYKVALKRIQSCYGRFFNITDFRAKDAYKVKFVTNFNRVYKTPDGIVYATPFNNIWRTIFYTHHAFERFEERHDSFLCHPFHDTFKRLRRAEPTAADLLMFIVSGRWGYEYGKKENFYFLNVGVGFLVLEDFEEFFMAKTFLTADMCDPQMSWFKPLLTEDQANYPSSNFKSVKEILDHDPIKITGPTFLENIMKDLVKEYIANNRPE